MADDAPADTMVDTAAAPAAEPAPAPPAPAEASDPESVDDETKSALTAAPAPVEAAAPATTGGDAGEVATVADAAEPSAVAVVAAAAMGQDTTVHFASDAASSGDRLRAGPATRARAPTLKSLRQHHWHFKNTYKTHGWCSRAMGHLKYGVAESHEPEDPARWRHRLALALESHTCQLVVLFLLTLDMVCVFGEILLSSVCDPVANHSVHTAEGILHVISNTILIIFLLQQLLLFVALGLKYFGHVWYIIDFIVIVVALVLEQQGGSIIVVVMFWRVIRIVHGFAMEEIEVHEQVVSVREKFPWDHYNNMQKTMRKNNLDIPPLATHESHHKHRIITHPDYKED